MDEGARKQALEGVDEEVARHATSLEERTSQQQQEIEQRVVREDERLEGDKQARIARLAEEGVGLDEAADRRAQIEVEIEREKERTEARPTSRSTSLARKMNEEIEAKEGELQGKREMIEKLAPCSS